MIEQRVHMAEGDDKVSVRQRKCCGTLFNGRLIRFILFRVAVNHGSTFVFRTTFGGDRGANAAADAGNNIVGMTVIIEICDPLDGWNVFDALVEEEKWRRIDMR